MTETHWKTSKMVGMDDIVRRAEAITAYESVECVVCGHRSAHHSDIGNCCWRACNCMCFEEEAWWKS